jgi:hypothetical protein
VVYKRRGEIETVGRMDLPTVLFIAGMIVAVAVLIKG